MSDELQAAETLTIARKMADEYWAMVGFYEKQYKLAHAEASEKAQAVTLGHSPRALTDPPDTLSWYALTELQDDPEAFGKAWGRVKQAAADELQSGHRAARAVEGYDANPMRRARFLAIRHSMIAEWQPRGGIEAVLVDVLAQAHHAWLFWLEQSMNLEGTQADIEKADLEREGKWRPMRIGSAEAGDRAAAMIDRYNRIFLRTLRALRDLRRYAPSVHIENVGQVNIGGQQVNLADGVDGRKTADDRTG